MEKFMTARVNPNPATTAASRHARRRIRPHSAARSGRAPATAITAAAVHSRRPVTAAGAICANSLAARPAPNWTEKMPVSTSAEGGTAVNGARRFLEPTITGGLLPPEEPGGQRDADRGPDDQYREIAHRQPRPVLQDGVQPVGEGAGGQEGEHRPRRRGEPRQREDDAPDPEQHQVDQVRHG